MGKLTEEQLREVRAMAINMRLKSNYFRKGQAYFNALYTLHPEIADEIRATKLDMFYIDENIENFENKYKDE